MYVEPSYTMNSSSVATPCDQSTTWPLTTHKTREGEEKRGQGKDKLFCVSCTYINITKRQSRGIWNESERDPNERIYVVSPTHQRIERHGGKHTIFSLMSSPNLLIEYAYMKTINRQMICDESEWFHTAINKSLCSYFSPIDKCIHPSIHEE